MASADTSALEARIAALETSMKNVNSWIDVLKTVQAEMDKLSAEVNGLSAEVNGKRFYGGNIQSRIDNVGYCVGRLIEWVQSYQTSGGKFDQGDNITNPMTCHDVAQ